MTTPTWQEACTPVTQAEYVDQELAALEAAGSNLNGWSDDAPQRALVEGEATALAAGSDNISALAQTASPATVVNAGASWVDAVMGWFGIEREPATRAVWMIELAYLIPSTFTIDATNAGQIQGMAEDGTIFLCTQEAPVQFNAGNGYAAQVQFTAREAGVVGNITQDTFESLISGPAGLQVISPGEGGDQDLVTAARAEETSAAFVTRGLGRWGVIGPSTDSALGSAGWTSTSLNFLIPFFGNTATTSVTRWSVNDANPLGPGTVLVTLADDAGPATALTVAAVTAGLNGLSVKPVGSGEITVQAATAHPLTINAQLQTDGTVGETATIDAAEAALSTLGAKFPLGVSKLTPDLVNAILMGAPFSVVSIETSPTDKQVQLDLAGFAGIEYISTTDFTSDEIVSSGQVLVLTVNVTVLV